MILETTITAFGETFKVNLDTEKLDRNYDDEDYAYWILEHSGHYFEINVWKENETFTTEGKAYAYINLESFEYADLPNEECELVFNIIK